MFAFKAVHIYVFFFLTLRFLKIKMLSDPLVPFYLISEQGTRSRVETLHGEGASSIREFSHMYSVGKRFKKKGDKKPMWKTHIHGHASSFSFLPHFCIVVHA